MEQLTLLEALTEFCIKTNKVFFPELLEDFTEFEYLAQAEWSAKCAELHFGISDIYTNFSITKEKILSLLSIPNFLKIGYFEKYSPTCLTFKYYDTSLDFYEIKDTLKNKLWEEVGIPVEEYAVLLESDFYTNLLLPSESKINMYETFPITFSVVNKPSLDIKLPEGFVYTDILTNLNVINIRSI